VSAVPAPGALGRARPALERFFFAPVDARAAGALRILLGAALPFFFRTWTLPTPPGWPENEALAWLYANVFGTPGHEATILLLCALLALGFRARRTAALLVLVLLPLAFPVGHRQSRQILLFVLAAFAFVPSDAAWTPFRRPPRRAAPGHAGPIWPVRLIQLQLSVLYGVNALAKATPAWWSGDVLLGMSLALDHFLLDLSSGSVALGPIAVPVSILAPASMLTEAFLAVAFWIPRLRWPAAVVGVGFHTTLRFVLRIHMLGWATMLLYAGFLLPLAARENPWALDPDRGPGT
jgi:hypothetical protein